MGAVGSPQLAIGTVVAEGGGATGEGARGFDDRLQRGALPHEVGGLQVVPTPRQLVWRWGWGRESE